MGPMYIETSNTNESPCTSQMTWPNDNLKKEKNFRYSTFCRPIGRHFIIKEIETKDMYMELVRETRKLCYISVMVILIVTGGLRTVLRGLQRERKELETREKIETIQTTALLRSTRILRRVLETWSMYSLFNGLSTFVGYLMAKKNSSGTI